MTDQTKKDLIATLSEQKISLKEADKQKHQDNEDEEYDWNDYDDEEEENNQQAKNLHQVKVNPELYLTLLNPLPRKPKTITGLKDYFSKGEDNSFKDNKDGAKYRQKDSYSSANNSTQYSQYTRFNTFNSNQPYSNSSQSEVIVNNNTAYAKKPKYYNRQYGYTSDTKKYSNPNVIGKREGNHAWKDYTPNEQYIPQTATDQMGKRYNLPANRDYPDNRRGNKDNGSYQYQEPYRRNYARQQGYYAKEQYEYWKGEQEQYEYGEGEQELVEEISKPMFVNTKLEGENNFADLEKGGDLFLKKFQKAQSCEYSTSKDFNKGEANVKAQETVPLTIEQKPEQSDYKPIDTALDDNHQRVEVEAEEEPIPIKVQQKGDVKPEETPFAPVEITEPLPPDNKEQIAEEASNQPSSEITEAKEGTEIHHSYTTQPEGYYHKTNYYGHNSYQYNPYYYQNRRGGRYNSYYNNDYNRNYYNNYHNNTNYNSQGYYYDNGNYQNNYNDFDDYNDYNDKEPNLAKTESEPVKEPKKVPEENVKKIVESNGNKVTLIFKNTKSLKELFK